MSLKHDVADVGATVAVGLDADGLIGSFEGDALDADVLYAAGDFAADGDAVAVLEGAVGDGDVLAGIVGAGRVGLAALDGDIVVAGVGVDMVDDDVRGTEGVDRIGVRRGKRRGDADIADDHVVGVVGDDLPEGRVLDRDADERDVLAVVPDDEARACGLVCRDAGTGNGGGRGAAHHVPPGGAVAVDGAFAGDVDVLGVNRADESLMALLAEFGDDGVVVMVGRAEERGVFGEVERDAGLEQDGRAEVGSGGDFDRASGLVGGAGVDGFLDGGGVLGFSVAGGAEFPNVAGFACGQRWERTQTCQYRGCCE